MKKKTLLGLIISLCAFISQAQTNTAVVPSVNEQLDGAATDGGGSGTLSSAGRFQVVYSASQFPVGVLTIHELRMRPSAVWGNAFTSTIPNLQINLSTTAAQADQLSSTFAQNVGTNDTIVFHGSITVSSRFVGPGGGPKEFDIIFPLTTPFTYDPSKGNLLLDIRNPSGSTAAFVDAGGRQDDGCSRAYAFSSDATTAVTRDKAADVLQVVYTVESLLAPWITTQPQSHSVAVGETVNFSVAAGGSPPLNYQWRFNGTDIGGATASSLTLSNVQSTNAGDYSVVVSNTSGSVTSQVAVLSIINGSLLVVPSVNEHLDGSATDGGGSGMLSDAGRFQTVYDASQFPAGILTIRELRMRPSATWGHAFTSTISNLQINLSTTAAQANQLSTNFAQNVGGNDTIVFQGTIAVSSGFVGPAGGPKEFDIVFALTTPFAYDPSQGNLLLEIRNPSGSTAAFVDAGGRLDDGCSRAYAFSSEATNAVTRDKAAEVLQLVYTLEASAPWIVSQPASRSVTAGETVTFNVTARGTPPLSYQWRFNGSEITGATASSLTLNNIQPANAGEYSVVVSSTSGSVTSEVAVLSIINGAFLVVPSVNEQLDGSATDGGGSGILNASGRFQTVYDASQFPGGILTIYELRMRPSAVWGHAFTSAIPNLQINLSTTAAQANQLSATFAQNVGTNDTVVFQGPITVSSRFTGPAGGPKEFDIVFPLSTPFNYDPSRGNLLLDVRNLSGSSAAFVDAGGRLDDGSSRGYAFSSDATNAVTRDKAAEVLQLLYTIDASAPWIISQPQSRSVSAGETVIFSVVAGGSPPLSYQWRFNGTDIGGATASSLTLSNVQPANAGEYSVVVSSTSGSVTSQVAVLSIINGSFLVVPSVNEHLDGSATDGGGSGTLNTGGRFQVVYSASQFPAGILTIHELRMRPSAVWGNAFTSTIANLQINLSTTAAQANQLSATFAQNVGANDTVVFQGPITISSRFVGPAGGPKEFDIIFPLSTPFNYDPSQGNLLLDIRNPSGSTAAFVDAGGRLDDGASRAYAFSSDATSAAGRDKAADVLQVVYTIGSPLTPWITTQPQSRSVGVGETVILSVGAGGTPPLNYQWRFNGGDLGGTTASSLSLSNVQSAHAGEYSVVVSNTSGSVTSQVAVLRVGNASQLVIPPGLETRNGSGATGTLDVSHRIQEVYGASMFPAHPVEILEVRFRPNISLGHAFTTVVANMQIRLSTTQKQADHLSTTFAQNVGADETTVFSGALNLSSSFSGPVSGPKDFDVIVPFATPFIYDPAAGNLLLDIRNFSGSGAAKMDGEGATSDGASRLISLNVNGTSGNPDSAADVLEVVYRAASSLPPSILAQPQSRGVTVGETVTFGVSARGSPPLNYQWRFNGSDIDGAMSPSLTINSVQFSQAGEYSVMVSNPYGSATSSNAVLAVNAVVPRADYDLSADYSLSSNPNGVWSYGWEETMGGSFNLLLSSQTLRAPNGVPVQIWSLTPNTAPAVYHNATTDTATSDYGQGIFPPNTTWFYAGENGAPQNFGVIRFTVPSGGDGTYRLESAVRPYLNGPPGNDTDYHVLRNNAELFGEVVAANGSSGYSNNLALAAGDTIDFVIGRGLDNNNSGLKILATLDLVSTNPVPPTIVVQPQSQTVDVGTTVNLGVGVNGSLPLIYQWQLNGVDIGAGTNSTLVLEVIQTSQAGDYRVLVSNAYGSVTSAVATVTVHSSEVAPTVGSQPVGGQVLAGSTMTLEVGAVGTAPLTYQWFYNGLSISGATSTSLVLSNILLSQSGSYWAVVSNSFGFATSRAAAVSVVESFAGGTVRFANGTNSLVYDVDGASPLPAGSAYLTQLYAGPDANSLQPIGAAVGFSSPGRFSSGTRTITSVPAGGVATVQVKVWEAAYGQTYEHALAAGGKVGASAVFTVTTGGGGSPPTIPASLTGLQSFSLMPAAGATPPSITSQPSSRSVLLGQNTSFSVGATGPAPLLYQWRFNGTEIPGATGTTLSMTNVSDANAGNYTVVVRNNGGAVTSVVATLTVETQRLLTTENLGAAAEGDAVLVPIDLISPGDVGGMTFVLRYNADYLSSPLVTWDAVLEGALREVNQTAPGELRFVFAFGSGTVPGGTQSLATVNLRARTVIENAESQLALQVLDISGSSGDPILYGSAAQSGSVAIVPTSSLQGDNNANGRLDVGDATLLLRLLALLDTTRSWDISQNDLNHNGVLDSGDAVKILRTAAGIGAPGGALAASGGSMSVSSAGAGASATAAGTATLAPSTLLGNPGSLVTVQVRLQGVEIPIAGASFTVNYPANILRLRGVQDHRAGALVPRNAAPVWNVAPNQNDYSTQSGQLRFAVGTSSAWSANNGVLAELTFQVQNPPPGQVVWPITLSNVEVTPDGYELDTLQALSATFSTQPQLGGVARTQSGLFTFGFGAGNGGSFVIEASTNLVNWVVLTNVANASGSVQIADPGANQFPRRFYRARIQ
jgi:plastocyanin